MELKDIFMLSSLSDTAHLQTERLDHHGLIASICNDIHLAEKIDVYFPKAASKRKVSPGKAVVAMIINGLGFTNHRLYLTHQFYEGKPINRLLGCDISANDLTDYTLANTLDDIHQYGASDLFGRLAHDIALEENILGTHNHLDTTSLTVQGAYNVDDPAEVMELTYGHSKDHRPDLKQAVLSLVVNGPASIPLWMEPLNGNSSDRSSFHETIAKVNAFQQEIDFSNSSKWVSDSALYNQEKLLRDDIGYLWLTRVPETIKAAKNLVSLPDQDFTWETLDNGYKISSKLSHHSGIKQRWLLVYSEQAYQREKKTLERKLAKQGDSLKKSLWHHSNKIFKTKALAEQALKVIGKKYCLFKVAQTFTVVEKHLVAGRPSADAKKEVVGYQASTSYEEDREKITALLNKKGRFILATNDLDKTIYPDHYMLDDYKSQQNVEGGFRFLKDPWFMVSSIFLKLPRRIESLMMIMTLCLFVYNLAQYKLREALVKEDETLPNQLGKEIKNPTMRWIFQLMEGISIVKLGEELVEGTVKEFITNLSDIRRKIIYFFGKNAVAIYGLKNAAY